MEEYQENVIAERSALDEKLTTLISFLGSEPYDELTVAEKLRLQDQAQVMTKYSSILKERIENF